MLNVFVVLTSTVAVFLILIIPGHLLMRLLCPEKIEYELKIILVLALGLALVPFIGIILDYTSGINRPSLLVAYGLIASLWAASIVLKSKVSHLRNSFKVSLKDFRLLPVCLVGASLIFAIYDWRSGIGVHSGDMGWHVFWAKTISNTQHLPNYYIVEPFTDHKIFVFGPHLLLAEFSTLASTSLDQIFWIPSVLFAMGIVLSLFTITKALSGSNFAGILTTILYGSSFIPGGYILRGNLPDILGYFLLTALIALSTKIFVLRRFLLIFGFLLASLLAYHQYEFLTAGVLLFIFLVFLAGVHKDQIKHIAKVFLLQKEKILSWSFVAVTFILLLQKVQYVSGESIKTLQSTNWLAYVIPLSDYPNAIGEILFVIGILGILVLIKRRSFLDLVILSWVMALFILANGPLFGLGIEPPRFRWRMIEPFSVLAGVGIYHTIEAFTSRLRNDITLGKVHIMISYSKNRDRKLVRTLVTLIIITSIVMVTIPSIEQQQYYEPYFETDKQIGAWLATHSNFNDVIAVDADSDNTVNWIQVFAMRQYFLYKVDYATNIAAVPHRYVYENASYLFGNPSSPKVLDVVRIYNISYVIVHGQTVSDFHLSPFFVPVYVRQDATVFKPLLLSSYGEVVTASGYRISTTSGRIVALLTELVISFTVSEVLNLTIPIYSHVGSLPLPITEFNVYVDDEFYTNTSISDGEIIDFHINITKFWPSLEESGVGKRYDLSIQLTEGSHLVKIVQTSDIDFEIYLDDLVRAGISLNLDYLVPIS